MSTYSVLLVDDEQAAHYAMQRLFEKYDEINLIGQAYNGMQAVEKINSLRPDLIFLDIQMPDMDGFEILKQLEHQPYIIFCTAYDQYAIEAFNENSIDYLLKPVDENRFAQCVDKIKKFLPQVQKIDMHQLQELSKLLFAPKKASAISITIGSKIIFVSCQEITYCVAKDGYISIMTDEGKEHICNLTLKQLEDRLPDYFIRVQKSYIVNKQKIEEIQKHFNNRLILKMRDKGHTKITTGTSYINLIREELLLG